MSDDSDYPLRGEEIEVDRWKKDDRDENQKFNIFVSPRLHEALTGESWTRDPVTGRREIGYSVPGTGGASAEAEYPLRGEDLEIRRNEAESDGQTQAFRVRVSKGLHVLIVGADEKHPEPWKKEEDSDRQVLGYLVTEDGPEYSHANVRCK